MIRARIAVPGILLALFVLPAALPSMLTRREPFEQDLEAVNQPPSLSAAPGQATHPLGTDGTGQDLLARLLAGARTSFSLSLGATIAAILLGAFLGIPAGYFGGVADAILTRTTEVLYGLPHLLLVLFLVASIGTSPAVLLGVLGAFQGLALARILRLEARAATAQPFVEAARALGAGHCRILWRHLLPALAPVIATYGLLSMPALVLQESFLGFLGFSSSTATLGGLLAEGQETLSVYPWQILVPGVYLTLVLGALTVLAEGLRSPPRRVRAGTKA